MRSSNVLWKGIGIVSGLTTVLFIAGFTYAMFTVFQPGATGIALPSSPLEEAAREDGMQIVTLGDSLTRGAGDSIGKGYAGRVKDQLETILDEPVYFIPLAVNGYRTDQLLHALNQNSGISVALKSADIVLLTIGGNDLFSIGNELNVEESLCKMPGALERLNEIFALIKKFNEQTQIIYLGLYNPFAEIDSDGESSLFVQQWNYEVAKLALAYDNITVVPTFDLFYRNTDQLLSSDKYHPNDLGYQKMAERVMQTLY